MGGRAGGGAGSGRGGGGYNYYAPPKGEKATYNSLDMGGGRYTVSWNGTGADGKSQQNFHIDSSKARMNKFIKDLEAKGYTGNGGWKSGKKK